MDFLQSSFQNVLALCSYRKKTSHTLKIFGKIIAYLCIHLHKNMFASNCLILLEKIFMPNNIIKEDLLVLERWTLWDNFKKNERGSFCELRKYSKSRTVPKKQLCHTNKNVRIRKGEGNILALFRSNAYCRYS